MSRHYTDTEKRLVLDRLIANFGDVEATVSQTGIPERTVSRWKQEAQRNGAIPPPPPPAPPISSSPSLYTERGQGGEVLPPETIETFQDLHDQLLILARSIATRIEEAIDEAPLNQRMTALSQLIASITKLAALLPRTVEEVIYVDEYEYGVAHHVEKNPPRHLQENNDRSPQAQTGD